MKAFFDVLISAQLTILVIMTAIAVEFMIHPPHRRRWPRK